MLLNRPLQGGALQQEQRATQVVGALTLTFLGLARTLLAKRQETAVIRQVKHFTSPVTRRARSLGATSDVKMGL
jgi:hypothetical protein